MEQLWSQIEVAKKEFAQIIVDGLNDSVLILMIPCQSFLQYPAT